MTAGSYRFIVGSDMDNDYYICDAGESCGGYPSINNMVTIDVTSDISNIDFSVSFDALFGIQQHTTDSNANFGFRYR